MQKRSIVFVTLAFFILLIGGCAPVTPQTVVEKETVVKEVPVTVEVPVVVTATPEPTPEPVATVTKVTLPETETFMLRSSASHRDYTIYVAVPVGYAFESAKYPVLYLLDGQWVFVLVTEYSRWMGANSVIPKTIVVAIDNSKNRERDMLPNARKNNDADKFLSFILKDLVPYVDAHYRTKPADRTLAGRSYGAIFALYALFHAPETFNRYIVTSPSLSDNIVTGPGLPDPGLIFKNEETFASTHSDLPVKLYLSIGEREYAEDIDRLIELYEKLESRNYAGLDMSIAMEKGEGHHVTYIEGLLDGIRAVFRK